MKDSMERAWRARATILLLVALCCLGASLGGSALALKQHSHAAGGEARNNEPMTDQQLYESIARQVREGRPYHEAALETQRKNRYPTRPFYTVRPPLLSWLIAGTGHVTAWLMLIGVGLLAAVAWMARLRATPVTAMLFGFIMVNSYALYWLDRTIAFEHEAWAGAFIAMSLALSRDRTWPLAVAAGLLAMLIRELAVPFGCIMLIGALMERRRSEAAVWVLAIAAALMALWLHAIAVNTLVLPNDLSSRPYGDAGGPVLAMMSVLQSQAIPDAAWPAVGALVPLALWGWISQGSPASRKVVAVLTAYILLVALFARAENYYWASLATPLLLPGLAIGMAALGQSMVTASGRRAIEDRE